MLKFCRRLYLGNHMSESIYVPSRINVSFHSMTSDPMSMAGVGGGAGLEVKI